MLSALPSTDTGPLPFEWGHLKLCYRWLLWGALLISRNVAGMHQAYDLDCVLHINTCDSRTRTMAVGRCTLPEGVIRKLGYTKGFWV